MTYISDHKLSLKTLVLAALLSAAPLYASSALADEAIPGSEIVEIADIAVGLNGLVCDFCSLALNKTFKKSAAVESIYVDLDSKVMSILLKSDQTLDDAQIAKMVESAGYNVTQITRKAG